MKLRPYTTYCEPCIVKYTFRSERPLEDFSCSHCGRPLTLKHKRGFIKVRLGTDVAMLLKHSGKVKIGVESNG